MNTLFVRSLAVLCLLAAPARSQSAPASIQPVPAPAVKRLATLQVRVVPDRLGWTYAVGEKVTFRVTVTHDNQPFKGVTVRYKVGPEMMPTAEKTSVLASGELSVDGGTLTVPGFIRCNVTVEHAGKTYRGLATAGFAPGDIQPTQTEPADFDAFWAAGRAALAKVPLDPQITFLPDASTSTVNVYHVGLRTVGNGWAAPARVYGILCEPKAPGKYPAVLRVPGAGVRPYFGDRDLAARGAITLEIGIHGLPVNLPKEVYDQLQASALDGYWLYNFDDRERFYYRRVVLSALRANDFLASRDNWDGKGLVVAGASQGGMLAIITAALDQRVTGLAAIHPAFSDVSGSLHGRAGGWPQPFQPDAATGAPSSQATPAKIATATYFDTVNFARRLKVPGFYTWGYNDEVCPPTSMFAAYNVISAPKELLLSLEVGHAYPPEQGAASNDAIARFLALKPTP